MKLNSVEISEIIKQRIDQFNIINENENEGTIISVMDGIIRIYGLSKVMLYEVISLPTNNFAIAMNLERDSVCALVVGLDKDISEGMKVKCTGRTLEVPVGKNLLGRVVNALGLPLDNKGSIEHEMFASIESEAPSVIDRQSINEPLHTGYKSIDTMTPIGLGQRELIIGDRQTGKSTLAIDTIINQCNSNIKCIYVAIGQKTSSIVNIVNKLEKYNALKHTIVICASASDTASLQYIVPYAGCTMGEYFRNRGENALIIYDDLSKHAVAYRQISLLLRRPPGREAYPGDIFYLHSRLLERAARVSKNYVQRFTQGKIINKTGSLTAIPIIETQAGDISSFIPTNVISITDGQIFLESNLFKSGIKPAINPGISVSRVGGAAQTNIIKKLSGNIRTSLAQYKELFAFSQFSSDLDETSRRQIDYGKKIIEILKQKQHSPMSVAHQVLILFAIQYDYLKDINVDKISDFEKSLIIYAENNYSNLISNINLHSILNEETEKKLQELIENFKKEYF